MSRRDPAASRSSSKSRAGGGRGPKVRTDGKVDVSCPQCGTTYRIADTALDQKLECVECHRVFFPKTTVGKRAKTQDNTKTYLIFGGVALALIVLFVVISNSNANPVIKPPVQPVAKKDVLTPMNHPRTQQLVLWAQAMGSDSRLVIQTHSDLNAVAKVVGLESASDPLKVFAAIQTHDSTRYLRELMCESGMLADEATMTAPSGKAILYVTPKPGTDDYRKNTRGDIEVEFRMEGDQVKVTGWRVAMVPARNPNKPDPSAVTYAPNKDIAKPELKEITDSAGTRKVKESQPAAVPHWDKATPELQKKADQVVADILRAADPEAPGGLYMRTKLSVRTLDEKKAVVPRILNAMYELYGDVNSNNEKLILLDKALADFTGFAVNYESKGTGDAAKDKALRESSIRQWFAFWYRYSNGDLTEFIDTRENLDEPLEPPKKSDKK